MRARVMVAISVGGFLALACSSVVKIPADCYFDQGVGCSEDAECGADATCDTALSTPQCIKTSCAPDGALCSSDAQCQGGSCSGSVCTTPAATCSGPGEMVCDGNCVNTQTDPAHCGGCDQPVPDGTTCVAGSPSCGQTNVLLCNGSCVDVSADPSNCGACNKTCPSTYTCNGPAGPAVCSKNITVTTVESCNDACGTKALCTHGDLHYTTSNGPGDESFPCDGVASPPAQATSWYLVCTCVPST